MLSRIELRPSQQELVDKLGDEKISGRLIGDEMGLGKTVEACAIDKRLRLKFAFLSGKKTLIICPRGGFEVWFEHIQAMVPGSYICVIDRKSRGKFIHAVKHNKKYTHYIMHYEALRLKDMQFLAKVTWFHIILDEAHRIKNPKAQVTLAAKRLLSRYKTECTGTPADDKPLDMWSLLHFLYPVQWSSRRDFEDEYCGVYHEENELTGAKYRLVSGAKKLEDGVTVDDEAMAQLHRLIAPYYMRRLKKDVLDLPPKVYHKLYVDLNPKQRRIYNELCAEMLAWIGEHENEPLSAPNAISRLMRLQQVALATPEWGPVVLRNGKPLQRIILTEPSSKLDELMRWLGDEGPLPIVLFSRFKSMIRLATERLEASGLKVAMYTGDTKDDIRPGLVSGFQAGKYDVFAATIATGGEILTLTRAQNSVFFDRLWGPSKNHQAEDRIHRITQTRTVNILDLYARDTVDADVKATNIRKWADLKRIMGDKRGE